MQKQENKKSSILFTIAPMIDITNTHFRYFMRLITKKATLYTEMLHHDAVIHGHSYLLPFNQIEHPVVLQLGGSDPQKLAEAALLGQKYGYDEINLNVGCPSPKVQKGSFGACLMKQAGLVRDCMIAMAKTVDVQCSVKCRLGIDDFDSYEFVKQFVEEVSEGGKGLIKHFIIHARKAILKGLNPAQNRSIPPLMYDRVYRLKEDFPYLSFQINGGLKKVKEAHQIADKNNLQGCMVGRLANQNPFELIYADQIFYEEPSYLTFYESDAKARHQIMIRYADYIQKLQKGQIFDQFGNNIRKANNSVLVKPIINFYNGQKQCGRYRQYLSDMAKLKDGALHVIIRNAAKLMAEGGFRYKNLKSGEAEEQQEQKQELQLKIVKQENQLIYKKENNQINQITQN